MCLAVPGKIIAIDDGSSPGGPMGTVDLQGSRLDICLVLTPDVRVDDWVLVHAGFAIELLDESDALQTWEYLNACYTDRPSSTGEANQA